jgi:hypothetical protein
VFHKCLSARKTRSSGAKALIFPGPGGTAKQFAEKWDVFFSHLFRELFFRALLRSNFVFSGHFFDR